MSSTNDPLPTGVIHLPPGEGRHYPLGPMQSVFLADGEETGDRYAVSIWWVDPGKPGPGAHHHEANEELFYVIEGTMTFLVGARYVDAIAGTFLRIPAGVTHGFENRTARRAGALNVLSPAVSNPTCRRSSNGTAPKLGVEAGCALRNLALESGFCRSPTRRH